VRLPVAVVRESESGGRTVATIDDAGVEGFPDAGGSTNPTYHNCLPTSSDGQSLDLSVGRGLALTIADTPAEVHLVVRESGNLIFEDDLSIEYQTEFPSGPNCRSVERGQVFVRLPNSES
jgi:hypothetical protein